MTDHHESLSEFPGERISQQTALELFDAAYNKLAGAEPGEFGIMVCSLSPAGQVDSSINIYGRAINSSGALDISQPLSVTVLQGPLFKPRAVTSYDIYHIPDGLHIERKLSMTQDLGREHRLPLTGDDRDLSTADKVEFFLGAQALVDRLERELASQRKAAQEERELHLDVVSDQEALELIELINGPQVSPWERFKR